MAQIEQLGQLLIDDEGLTRTAAAGEIGNIEVEDPICDPKLVQGNGSPDGVVDSKKPIPNRG